jgi:hypothetical protein
MGESKMYTEFAHLWPWVSPPGDYAEEAAIWRDTLRGKLGPGRHHILELGVGGGNNLSHLTSDFDAIAVDPSDEMMDNSRRLNPDVDHYVGDMRTVRLGRTFDAVLIHDAISYMLTERDIRQTFDTAREHLKTGGVLIVAPDWYLETFDGPIIKSWTTNAGDIEFACTEYSHDPDPNDTQIENVFVYFIRESGVLRIEQDIHTVGLFPKDTWSRVMDESGFDVELVPYPVADDGREMHLIVGVLRE